MAKTILYHNEINDDSVSTEILIYYTLDVSLFVSLCYKIIFAISKTKYLKTFIECLLINY